MPNMVWSISSDGSIFKFSGRQHAHHCAVIKWRKWEQITDDTAPRRHMFKERDLHVQGSCSICSRSPVQHVRGALFNGLIQLERWSPVQYVRGALFNVKELMHRMVVSNGCATSALLRHGRRVVYVMFNCSGFLAIGNFQHGWTSKWSKNWHNEKNSRKKQIALKFLIPSYFNNSTTYMAFLRKKKVKFNVELVVQKLTDVPLLNAVIFAKVRLLEGGSFVGVTLHRPVCSHQVDFMSPSVSRRLNDSAPLNIRLRNRTNSGQFYSNAYVHRHSTTDIIDDVSIFCDSSQNSLIEGEQQKQCSFSPSSHKKFQQIERRHSLTERSPREYYDARPDFGTLVSDPGTGIIHDYMKDELKEKQQQSVQQNFESDYFFDELGNLAYAEKNTQPFVFVCYIPYDSKYTGELEACRFKISLRKEDRAGRNPQKLGFVIINLSEFAGTGSTGVEKSFLLDGYVRTQRQDNSRVHIFIRMQHNSSDPLFKVPNSASLLFQQQNEIEDCHDQLGQWLNPIDRRAPSSSPNENIGLGSGVLNTVNSTTISSAITSNPIPIDSNLPSTSTTLTIQSSNNGNINSNCGSCSGGSSISLLANSLHLSGCGNISSLQSQQQINSGGISSSSFIITCLSSSFSIPTTISSISNTFPTVPGGLGHNMSMRVQRTRRDPGDVIEEVLAENCATINSKPSTILDDEFNNINNCISSSSNENIASDDEYKSS